jgi:hypothetical protein
VTGGGLGTHPPVPINLSAAYRKQTISHISPGRRQATNVSVSGTAYGDIETPIGHRWSIATSRSCDATLKTA